MVAMVSGNGLGLFNTSLTNLGFGLGGTAGFGQARTNQFVNVATGNLMLQDTDELLSVRGFDAAFQRTYNSRGLVADAGADGFVTGYERRVSLTGTLNNAGSTMALRTGDGQVQIFGFSSTNVYVSTEGDGANDKLTWNGSTWTLVEGSSRREEQYASHRDATLQGRLMRIRDLTSDGTTPAQYDIDYDGDRVSEVRSIDGAGATADALVFTYHTSGSLAAVSTRESGFLCSQVRYVYENADGSGRLKEVLQDLSPIDGGDNAWEDTLANNDGDLFRTIYNYASTTVTDLRIASVTQSDGTVANYTYESDGAGGFRVKTASLGSGADIETVTFTYGSNSTDVSDGLGRVWTYKYDANKQLTEMQGPAIDGLRDVTTYSYDDGVVNPLRKGTVTQIKTVRGSTIVSQTDYQYDNNGNAIWEWQRVASGSAAAVGIYRGYDARNQLVWERRFSELDADGAGSASVLDPAVDVSNLTRYIRDVQGRLRFMRNHLGEVTEYIYATSGNGIGQLAAERRYLGATYAATFDQASMATWAADQLADSTLVEYSYDVKGRLEKTRAFANVDSSGAGITDAALATTTYIYSAQGLLLQQVRVRNGALLNEQTDYAYDGLGRLLSTIQRKGTSVTDIDTLATTYVYTDSGRQIVVTLDTGATRTLNFDSAHRQLSATEAGNVGGTIVTRTAKNYYDAAGQLRASEDASGGRRYFFYDAKGLLSGEVDATGAVVEYVRDAMGRVIDTIGYTGRVDTSSWLNINNASEVTPTDIALVRPGWSTGFDSLPIDGLDTIWIDRVGYPPVITTSGGGVAFAPQNHTTSIGPNISSTTTHTLAEQPSWRGEITTAASQVNTYLVFAAQNMGTGSAMRRAGVYFRNGNIYLTALVGTATTNTLVGTTTASTTYVVEMMARDGAVEFVVYKKGQDPATGISFRADADSSDWGATRLVVSGAAGAHLTAGAPLYVDNLSETTWNARHALRTYDGLGRLLTETDSAGAITTHAYNGYGERIRTDVSADGASTRTSRFFYDTAHRLQGTLDAEGYLTENSYDRAGRLVKSVRYATVSPSTQWVNGTLAQLRPAVNATDDQATRYFYDGRGNLIGLLDAQGTLTEHTYDEIANQRATTVYARILTGLTGTESLSALRTAAITNPPAEVSRITRRYFDGLGRLIQELNHEGTYTSYTYDDAGRLQLTRRAFNTTVVRSDFNRYDVFGNLIGEMSGEQVIASGITTAITDQTQLDNLYADYGTTHKLDLLGRRIESIDAQESKTWYFYDSAGRQTHVVRGIANTAGVKNTLGEVTETRYSAFGEVLDSITYTGAIAIASPYDRSTVATAITALAFVAGVDSRRSFTYTSRGQLASSTDATGALTRRSYNAFGELSREYRALGTSAARDVAYAYTNRGLLSAVTDGAGTGLQRSTLYTYDAFGRALSTVDARGIVSSATYDRVGRQLTASRTVTVFGGNRVETTATSYDAFGRVLTQTDAMGAVTTYAYSDVNRSVAITMPEGTVVTDIRNRHGEVSSHNVGGAITTYTYNANGQVISVTDPLNRASTNEYDVRKLLLASTDASGQRVELSYDAVGRVLTRTVDAGAGGLKLSTRYSYEAQGRVLTVTDPSGRVVRTEYDAEGRITEIARDPAGLNLRTAYTYDSAGRQITVTEGAGTASARTVRYAYDVLGRRTSETVDPAGLNLVTSYLYDANDNVIRRIDANGNSTRFAYDAANRLVFTLDLLGGVSRNFYDADGRLVASRRYAAAVALTSAENSTMLTATGVAAVALLDGKVVADDQRDAISFNVYDSNSRLSYTIDALGSVNQTTYSSAGLAVNFRRYAAPLALTTALRDKLMARHVNGQSNAVNAEDEGELASLLSANSTTDQQTRHVYDGAGQLRYLLTRASASTFTVAERRYDAAGRVVTELAFGVTIADTTPMNTTDVGAAVTAAGGNSSVNQRLTRHAYDGAGRLRFTVDDGGTVSENVYDAAGRVVEQRTYYTPIPTSATTESAILAELAADRQTQWSTDLATLPVTGLTTTHVGAYGSALTYANGELVFQPGNWATTTFPSVMRSETHDSNENVVFSGEIRTGASLSTTWFKYSIENTLGGADYCRAAIQITNGVITAEAFSNVGGNVVTTLGTVAANTTYVIEGHSRAGGVDYYIYAKGTDRAQGICHSIERNEDWGDIRLKLYSYARPSTDGNPIYVDNLRESVGASRHSSTLFDAAGRAIAVTDSLGNTETYGYDDAGNRTSRTDALGNTWTYTYDAAGRVIDEIGPPVSVLAFGAGGAIAATTQSLTTHTTYDAMGNALTRTEAYGTAAARTTSYQYDALGRQTKTIFPLAGSYDAATQTITTSGTAPYSQVTYDTLGNAVVNRDVLNKYSYKAYDVDGSLRYDVDTLGYVTEYDYDGFGQKIALTRYATAMSLVADGNWSPGQALSVAEIDSRKPAATNARTIQTVYDQRGQRTLVREPSVSYLRTDGVVDTANPTTAYAYDAYGRVVKESILLCEAYGSTAESWAHTFNYYDDLGRKTMSVDALGYVSTWAYDALGQLTSATEYARAISTDSLNTTVKPALPVAGDAAIGYDRTTTYTYDAVGRKLTEAADHLFQTGAGNSGVRSVVTAIEYDALGHATATVTDGSRTQTKYDALGRVVNVTEASRQVLKSNWQTLLGTASNDLGSAGLYDTVSPYTTMEYDALGNAVRVVRFANGKLANGTVTADAANDQTSISRYDLQGRLVMERDALGNERYREYDAADHVTKVWYRQNTGSGARWRVTASYAYDASGQQVQTQVTRQSELVNGTLTGAVFTDQLEGVIYNAFGEITDKGNITVDADTVANGSGNDDEALIADRAIGKLQHESYDAAGRHLGSNASGVAVTYQYNLAGHVLRESRPVFTSGSQTVTADTNYSVDKLGRATRLAIPVTLGQTAGTGYQNRRYDRWGNVLESVDARGYATSFEYNDRNQVVREIQATVRVLDAQGVESWVRPEQRYFYDALGRQVGMRDANGNVRRMEVDAAGRQVRTFDAYGSAQRFAYDALGRQAVHQDALGYLTYQTFDRRDQVLTQGDFLTTAAGTTRTKFQRQSFQYDQAGNRIQSTTVLNATENAVQKYDYDSRQLLLRSQSAMGVVGEFEYNHQGQKIREANNLSLVAGAPTWTDDEGDTARIDEQTWKYDFFGRLIDHNDLSGLDYDFTYVAGTLAHQSNDYIVPTPVLTPWLAFFGEEYYLPNVNIETTALDRTHEYYASGLVRNITDSSGTYLYEYDANGNRTMEESTAIDGRGTYVHVRTRIEYDSHNRVTRVTTYNVDQAKYQLDLSYSYDAMGNRRRVSAISGYTPYVDTQSGGSEAGSTSAITITEGAIRVTDASLDSRVFKSGVAGAFTIRMADVFQDPEGRFPTYAAVAASGSTWPTWLTKSYDAQTGLYTFSTSNASAADIGQTFTIQLKATDPMNGQVVSSFVTVSVATNTGPVTLNTVTPEYRFTSGQPMILSLLAADFFRDADVGDRLTLSVDAPVPGWMAVDASDGDAVRLTGVPTTGSHTVTLRVTDLSGAFKTKTITVKGIANVAPVALAVPTQLIASNAPLALDAPLSSLFTDLDPLNVTARMQDGTTLPSWLQFQYEPGSAPRIRLAGVAPEGLATGTQFSVVLTAVDPSGFSVSNTIVLQVGTPPSTPTDYASIVNNFNAGNRTLHAGQSIVLADDFFTRNGVPLGYDLRVAVWIEGSEGSEQYNQEIQFTEDAPHWEFRSLPDTLVWDAATRTITASAEARNQNLNLVVAPTELSFLKMSRNNYTDPKYQTFTLTIDQGVTATPQNREDYWFTYDAENRVQVVNGRMIGGQIMLRTDDLYEDRFNLASDYQLNTSLDPSYLQTYDAAGRAIGRIHLSIDGDVVYQQSAYTQRGELALTFGKRSLTNFDGSAAAYGSGISSSLAYDTAGRQISQELYFDPKNQNGETPLGYVRSSQNFEYNLDGQMTAQEEWGKAEGDTDPELDLLSRTTQTYDSIGRLGQRVYDHYGWESRPHNRGEDPPDAFKHTFVYNYEARDGYLEKSVSGTSNTEYFRATTSNSVYDALGRRIAVKEHTVLPEDLGEMEDRIRFFAYDAGAGILLRREGTIEEDNDFDAGSTDFEKRSNTHHYTYVNGQSVAHLTESGEMDVTSRLTAFDTQSGTGVAVVQEGDTLQRIAQRVYGDSGLWYVLAEANAIRDNDDLVAGMTLRTPAVKTVANTDKTYAPYDPSQVIGNTTPDIPWIAPPPPSSCDAVAIVLMAVVMVAIMCVAPYVATALQGSFGALAGLGGAAGGAFAGTVAGVAVSTGSAAIAAFATGVVASAASQVVGKALGVVDHFSLRAAVGSGLGAALTAGLSGLGTVGSAMKNAHSIGGWARVAGLAVVNASTGYVGNKIAGVEGTTFSWKSIAAGAVTSVVMGGIGNASKGWDPKSDIGKFAKDMTMNLASSVVSAHVRRKFGFDDEINYGAMLADALGNTLGTALGGSIASALPPLADEPSSRSQPSRFGGANFPGGRYGEFHYFGGFPDETPVELGTINVTATAAQRAAARDWRASARQMTELLRVADLIGSRSNSSEGRFRGRGATGSWSAGATGDWGISPIHAQIQNRAAAFRVDSSILKWDDFEGVAYQIMKRTDYGKDYVFAHKDHWVMGYRDVIVAAANEYDLPPQLLAGIAYNEVGGAPPIVDDVAIRVRRDISTRRKPEETSFGDMSLQVRRAAATLGYVGDLDEQQEDAIISSLKDPAQAILIAAMHVNELRNVDYAGVAGSELTTEQVQVVAARYNWGPERSLEKLKTNLSYGVAVTKRWGHLTYLLNIKGK